MTTQYWPGTKIVRSGGVWDWQSQPSLIDWSFLMHGRTSSASASAHRITATANEFDKPVGSAGPVLRDPSKTKIFMSTPSKKEELDPIIKPAEQIVVKAEKKVAVKAAPKSAQKATKSAVKAVTKKKPAAKAVTKPVAKTKSAKPMATKVKAELQAAAKKKVAEVIKAAAKKKTAVKTASKSVTRERAVAKSKSSRPSAR